MNSENELRVRMEQLFVKLFPAESVAAGEMNRVNCATWDSLAQANLVLAIEEEFGIVISDDEAMNLESFSAAWRLVAKAAG